MPAMFNSILLIIAFCFTMVHALPVTLVARDSVAPPITKPAAGDVWRVGESVTVTWDTSTLPPRANVSNPQGTIVLGFLENDSENLMLNSPLAKGFDIFAGSQDVTVPDVPPKDNYIIALIGNSGNISPEFSIVAKLASTPSPPISQPPPSLSSPVPRPTIETSSTPSISTPAAPTTTSSTSTTSVASSTTLTVAPSTTAPPATNTPASDNTGTSDAFTSKNMRLPSVAFAVVVVWFMI
ncbi:hypothetical protein BXZ70DRAFT_616953 [Cristinia sonorae]|uniref:Yeast cell wall synthesis Kre9/Knh1-like N-terminal domain-containing protein n=1 Tax=Cristinia sonorae TaxID=1940300 RepID=A0A8K0XT92_9AGAR|nr:hypothetical protein BXZ70DRAFT_616953 [Cristinia sonorae]